MIGNEIHNFAKTLWPINRSITGEGVRKTLRLLKSTYLPELEICEIPTGISVFDWKIPKEWNVNDAWIMTPNGNKICQFTKNNLHLIGYSIPVRKKLSLAELNNHLYSIESQPNAVPYITSYYKERWGFCITHKERESLVEGEYEVFVDSTLSNGALTYGELILKGQTPQEIFLSTYVCHPSMANNELSGITVTTFLAKWLMENPNRRYTYRIVFIPETIGSITYISHFLNDLKKNVVAGFNVSCIGDDRAYSYLPSREGDSLSDQIAKHVLKWTDPNYKRYRWSDRGSDERQYCAPGVDLPIASIMRTKYGQYPEYHTSLDDLVNVVTPTGLEGGFDVLRSSLLALERNIYPKVTVMCEPQLGRRGLYPTLSTKEINHELNLMMDLISYSDGKKSLLEISEICNVPIWSLYPIVDKLVQHQILIS